MTDDKIVGALKCCANEETDCEACPAYNLCNDDIFGMCQAILDLINRQQSEIERLKTENEGYKHLEIILNTAVDKLTANIKSEAIKEFAERLKGNLSNLEANSPNKTYKMAMQDMLDYYIPKIIDKLAKEMTEDAE